MMARVCVLAVLVGCGAPAGRPSERDRLHAIMGRLDRWKLEIQYRTPAPDASIPRRLEAMQAALREAGRLRPFGDPRDAILARRAPGAVERLGALAAAPWNDRTVRERWQELEATCADCHSAFER